ncbi:MAG: hypothetical protein ACFNWZ_00925 [Candidatus Absconditicoccaceae bacterium]
MKEQHNFWGKNWSLILTIILNAIALIAFFVKMDARVSNIEKRKDEINPQRVTIKDLLLIEEKIKNMGDNVIDMKSDIKEIKQMIK